MDLYEISKIAASLDGPSPSPRNKLLTAKNMNVCRSYMVGVTSRASYSREDRCVVKADVIILG